MYYSEVGDPNQTSSGLDTETYYYCSDNLGSTVALVDSSGDVVERYSYDVWGEPTITDGVGKLRTESDIENPFMFTAREVDFLDGGSLRLQHNRWRVYNYKLARWMQNDPLGAVPEGYMNRYNPIGQYKDGLNNYQYTKSSPSNRNDILGLWCGVVVKRQSFNLDEDAGPIRYGHDWIEAPNCNNKRGGPFSMGWYADGYEDLGDLFGIDGMLKSPDDYAYGADLYESAWITTRKLTGVLKLGPNAGKQCKCVTECKDICSCLESFLGNTSGTWGLRQQCANPYAYVSPYEIKDGKVIVNTGTCRDFVDYALNACCLRKSKLYYRHEAGLWYNNSTIYDIGTYTDIW